MFINKQKNKERKSASPNSRLHWQRNAQSRSQSLRSFRSPLSSEMRENNGLDWETWVKVAFNSILEFLLRDGDHKERRLWERD